MNISEIEPVSDEQKKYFNFLKEFLEKLQKDIPEKLYITRSISDSSFAPKFQVNIENNPHKYTLHTDYLDDIFFMASKDYLFGMSVLNEYINALRIEIEKTKNEPENNL